jgi:RHS repeat-associated protein
MVDNLGMLRLQRVFDSFGNIFYENHHNANGFEVTEGQTGYLDEAFAYTGRLLDEYTGLQNNQNRWYDASTGRWLSEDPLGFDAGDANLYRYVGNGPVNGVDPRGLWWPRPTGYDLTPVTMGPMIDPPLPMFPSETMPAPQPPPGGWGFISEPGLKPSWSPFEILAGICSGVLKNCYRPSPPIYRDFANTAEDAAWEEFKAPWRDVRFKHIDDFRDIPNPRDDGFDGWLDPPNWRGD